MTNEEIKEIENLIYKTARKFTTDKSVLEDLYQQGVIGALKAKNNYNIKSNTKFSTYANMYIYGEMYEYFNSNNKSIKTNKDAVKLYKLIKKTKELLTQELKKEPSIKDISKYLRIDESIISNNIKQMNSVLSLNYEYENNSFSNCIKVENNYENLEIFDMFSDLDDSEKRVLLYKYYEGYSQEEIAKIMDISQSTVSRFEQSGIKRIRTKNIL